MLWSAGMTEVDANRTIVMSQYLDYDDEPRIVWRLGNKQLNVNKQITNKYFPGIIEVYFIFSKLIL